MTGMVRSDWGRKMKMVEGIIVKILPGLGGLRGARIGGVGGVVIAPAMTEMAVNNQVGCDNGQECLHNPFGGFQLSCSCQEDERIYDRAYRIRFNRCPFTDLHTIE